VLKKRLNSQEEIFTFYSEKREKHTEWYEEGVLCRCPIPRCASL